MFYDLRCGCLSEMFFFDKMKDYYSNDSLYFIVYVYICIY